MIFMKLKANNLYCFEDFEINFTYPKKLVHSTVDYEYLEERPNFRFKRVNIIMGANATGKTSLGRLLSQLSTFFLGERNPKSIVKIVSDKSKSANFEVHLVLADLNLYRITCEIEGTEIRKLEIAKSEIGRIDTFEKASAKLKPYKTFLYREENNSHNYANLFEVLSIFDHEESGLYFTLNDEDFSDRGLVSVPFFSATEEYFKILDIVLRTFDHSIVKVERSKERPNTANIFFQNGDIEVTQYGKVIDPLRLSSGTLEGIKIAHAITVMAYSKKQTIFIDEIFSRTQSDLEIAILTVLIQLLGRKAQLFFTTHNTDILEINLPVHSFTFLRKAENVEVVNPSEVIKKNDRNLKIAVENDVFKTIPNTDPLDKIFEVAHENY